MSSSSDYAVYKSELQLVYPQIYLGNFFAARNKKKLNQKKITHIIVAAYELDTPYENQYKYLKLSLMDIPSHPIIQEFNTVFHFIESTLNCNSNNNILIHCAQGVSRSATIVIAYVMWKQRISFDSAFQQIKTIRPCIQPNWGFIEQLKEWESNLWPVQLIQENIEQSTNTPIRQGTTSTSTQTTPSNANELQESLSTAASSSATFKTPERRDSQLSNSSQSSPTLSSLDPHNLLSFMLGQPTASIATVLYKVQAFYQEIKEITSNNNQNKVLEDWQKLNYQKKYKQLDADIQSLIGAISLSQAHKHSSKSSSRSGSPSLTPNRSSLHNLPDFPPLLNLSSSPNSVDSLLDHNYAGNNNSHSDDLPHATPTLHHAVSMPTGLGTHLSHASLALAQLSTEAAPQSLIALASLQICEEKLHSANQMLHGINHIHDLNNNSNSLTNSPRLLTSSTSPIIKSKSLFSSTSPSNLNRSSSSSVSKPSSRSLVAETRLANNTNNTDNNHAPSNLGIGSAFIEQLSK